MSFNFSVNVHDVSELGPDIAANELVGSWLSQHETTALIPGALAAATELAKALGTGPFRITVSGADNLRVNTDDSVVTVSVSTSAVVLPVEPVSPPTKTVEPVTEPTEPVVEPTEPVTEPVEAPVAPTA